MAGSDRGRGRRLNYCRRSALPAPQIIQPARRRRPSGLRGAKLRELPRSRPRLMIASYLLDWLGLLVALAAPRGRHRLDRRIVLLRVARQSSAAARAMATPPMPVVAGELWAVHGGGFYRSQKYRLAPALLPPTLHWFYWEAYTTWLSGFALLCLLYFLRAEAYLIDPAVADAIQADGDRHRAWRHPVASWLVYDALCRSPLGRHGPRPGRRAWAAAVALRPGAVPAVQRARRLHGVRRRRSAPSWWPMCCS